MALCEADRQDLFANLLASEQRSRLPESFLTDRAVRPHMRTRLADWMLEVTQLFRCEKETFVCAMTFVDRYLVAEDLPLGRFQLLGAAALLVASKLGCLRHIHVPSLCECMEFAFSEDQVREQELALLAVLDWQLDVATPHDIFECLLHEMHMTETVGSEGLETLRLHADVCIDMCYFEVSLVQYGPALIAATALLCASNDLLFADSVSTSALARTEEYAALTEIIPNIKDSLLKCTEEVHATFQAYGLRRTLVAAGAPTPSPTRVHEAEGADAAA